jgi:TonB family protein
MSLSSTGKSKDPLINIMKKIVVCCLLIVCCGSSFAQTESKLFFRESGQSSSKENSYYYRVGNLVTVKSLIGTMDTVFVDSAKTYYTASGKLRSKEFHDAKGNLQNEYIEYFENGHLKEKGTYEKGRRSQHNYGFYPDGKNRFVLFYAPVEAEAFSYEENKLIYDYWDSLGNQLVKDGKGFCKCDFSTGAGWKNYREEGELAKGLRIGEWNFYRDEKHVNKETFDNGRFVKGIAYTGDGERQYTKYEEQAEFSGGLPALSKFLIKNLTYPRAARKRGAEGQSFVSFVIDKDGSVYDVNTVKELDEDLDEEARRVVRATTGQWSPGRQRGHPVKSRFVLPIRFRL